MLLNKHYHITSVLKSLHWLKIPQRIQYKIASLTTLFKPLNLLHSPTSHHPTTRVYSLIIISFLVYSPPVSSSLKFCNRSFAFAAPTLWNGLSKDLRQFAHHPNPPLNFTYPPSGVTRAQLKPGQLTNSTLITIRLMYNLNLKLSLYLFWQRSFY